MAPKSKFSAHFNETCSSSSSSSSLTAETSDCSRLSELDELQVNKSLFSSSWCRPAISTLPSSSSSLSSSTSSSKYSSWTLGPGSKVSTLQIIFCCILLSSFTLFSKHPLLLPSVEAKCPTGGGAWCLQIDGFDTIILDGNHFGKLGLSRVFQQIGFLFDSGSEAKELDQLLLINNHQLDALDRNAFCDFRFRRIVIMNCTQLQRVHPDAFNGTSESVQHLVIDNIGVTGENSEDFFEALNSLEHLEDLELKNHRLLKLRPYTFRQPKLYKLHLSGPLESIENNAFYYLDNIRILTITDSIRYIQQHAFDLRVTNNKTVDIYLDAKLGTVERGVFTYTQRPLTINLYLGKLKSLDIAVYRPILMAPIRHEIILHGNPKEMDNPCQLVWLFRQPKPKGVTTFKDEPEIEESYFDGWKCSTNPIDTHLDDELIPDIDRANQAGIDAENNSAASSSESGASFQLISLTLISALLLAMTVMEMELF